MFLILLAGGDSKRLKTNIPKPYQNINNKTLLEHSIYAFKDFKEINKIIIVYNKKHKKYLNKLNIKNAIKITGGKTRQQSTFNALKKLKSKQCDWILANDVNLKDGVMGLTETEIKLFSKKETKSFPRMSKLDFAGLLADRICSEFL